MNKEQFYITAFKKAMKCQDIDFKAKRWTEDKNDTSMLVEYNDKMYKIDTYTDVRYEIQNAVEFPEGYHIPASAISFSLQDFSVHKSSEFYFEVLKRLQDDENAQNKLSLVLSIYNTTNDNFWELLESFGGYNLYYKSIESLCQIFDKNKLISDLTDYTIEYGEDQLCMFVDGYYERIYLEEYDDVYDDIVHMTFYIYEVDYSFDEELSLI